MAGIPGVPIEIEFLAAGFEPIRERIEVASYAHEPLRLRFRLLPSFVAPSKQES